MELKNVGTLNLEKGIIRKGQTLFAWDGIQDCSMEKCVVYNKCNNALHKGKCAVHVNYIRTLYDIIISTYKYLNEMQYFKIGIHIVPLYSHLFRLKLLEMSITDVVYVNNKGVKFIHPVYKEIRQTLSTIHLMWKDLEVNIGIPSIPNPGESLPMEDSIINGDPNYYDSLTKRGTSIKKRIR